VLAAVGIIVMLTVRGLRVSQGLQWLMIRNVERTAKRMRRGLVLIIVVNVGVISLFRMGLVRIVMQLVRHVIILRIVVIVLVVRTKDGALLGIKIKVIVLTVQMII
jgi:hypothetical protein